MDRQRPKRIGLISSVQAEGTLISAFTRPFRGKSGGGLEITTGKLGGAEVVHIVSGIGKTNAAHAATVLVREFSPAFVINFGVGGAYPGSGLNVGGIAVAEKEIFADEGVLVRNGFQTLELIGIPVVLNRGRKLFNEFPLDKRLFKAVLRASQEIAPTVSGAFATVSTCSGTGKRAREIRGRFGAICENMEGAAVAQICSAYGTPCAEVRGISNAVEDRDLSQWDLSSAAENCQRAVIAFLREKS